MTKENIMPKGKQLHFPLMSAIRITIQHCKSKIVKMACFNKLLPRYFRKRIFCNNRTESSISTHYIF